MVEEFQKAEEIDTWYTPPPPSLPPDEYFDYYKVHLDDPRAPRDGIFKKLKGYF